MSFSSLLSLAEWRASLAEWSAAASTLAPPGFDVPAATLSLLPVVLLSTLGLVWFAARQGHAGLSGMLLHYLLLPCMNLGLLLWMLLALMPSTQDIGYQLELLLAQAGR